SASSNPTSRPKMMGRGWVWPLSRRSSWITKVPSWWRLEPLAAPYFRYACRPPRQSVKHLGAPHHLESPMAEHKPTTDRKQVWTFLGLLALASAIFGYAV